jgi:dehydrogenase/reductase SDR family protein 7B
MITGASSGLGESLAHSFYKAGCRIILAARRKEELERVRSDLLTKHAVRDNNHGL